MSELDDMKLNDARINAEEKKITTMKKLIKKYKTLSKVDLMNKTMKEIQEAEENLRLQQLRNKVARLRKQQKKKQEPDYRDPRGCKLTEAEAKRHRDQ